MRKKTCFAALLLFATWLVLPGAADALNIITSALQNGIVGDEYTQILAADAHAETVTWTLSGGSLPPGLSLAEHGVISGIPVMQGRFDFTVKASIKGGSDDTERFSITVYLRPAITTTSLPTGYFEWNYSETLHADGTQPITWTIIDGRLPRGLVLYPNSGVISGRPSGTFSNTYRFTVRASNVAGADDRRFSITVRENYLWDSGCSAGAGFAAAIAVLAGIRAVVIRRKNKNRKLF